MARLFTVLFIGLVLAAPVGAQTRVYSAVASCGAAADVTLSSNGDSFTCGTDGYASARLQTLDSYSGTWEVQCSVDGSTYDTDDELMLTLLGASSAAASVTDTVGIWDVNVAGCRSIKVISTAGFAASDTTFAVRAVATGGGSAGSGGGGGGGDATNAEQQTQTTHLAAIETAVESLADDVSTGNTVVRWISTGSSDDEFQVKATAGILAFVVCRNSNTSTDAYIKFTNATAANTTPGSTAVFFDLLIPAGPSGNNATPLDLVFDTALTAYIVTGKADNDATEVAANDVSCHVGYR